MNNRASRFSWMALVAATTLGPNAVAGTLRAQVRASVPLQNGEAYRLVVHSYDAPDANRGNDDAKVPFGAKPVGSAQLSVTAGELARGVDVDLVEVRTRDDERGAPLVVAWLEAGKADLEFDAREARPTEKSVVGTGRADSAYVALTLKDSGSRLATRISRTRRSKSRAA